MLVISRNMHMPDFAYMNPLHVQELHLCRNVWKWTIFDLDILCVQLKSTQLGGCAFWKVCLMFVEHHAQQSICTMSWLSLLCYYTWINSNFLLNIACYMFIQPHGRHLSSAWHQRNMRAERHSSACQVPYLQLAEAIIDLLDNLDP